MILSRRPFTGRSLVEGSRGQALVEAALVLPILVMVLLLAIDVGRVYFDHLSMRNGVREGAMYGAVNPTDDCTPNLSAVVASELGGADVQCDAGAYRIEQADCYVFTAPSTFTPCSAGPWSPTETLVYGVRLVHDFEPLVPLVGLLSGNGFGGTIPLTVADYSPVLTNYGS